MKETSKKVLFWALMFMGVFLLLTQVGYSDGDDAFFYQYTHEMGFLEYLSWRYTTWVECLEKRWYMLHFHWESGSGVL